MFFWVGKRWKSLADLYELCDNSSYNFELWAVYFNFSRGDISGIDGNRIWAKNSSRATFKFQISSCAPKVVFRFSKPLPKILDTPLYELGPGSNISLGPNTANRHYLRDRAEALLLPQWISECFRQEYKTDFLDVFRLEFRNFRKVHIAHLYEELVLNGEHLRKFIFWIENWKNIDVGRLVGSDMWPFDHSTKLVFVGSHSDSKCLFEENTVFPQMKAQASIH